MYFFFTFVLTLFGIIVAGICGLLPWETYVTVPSEIRYGMFVFGMILPIAGQFLLYMRADRVGATKLIAPNRPGTVLWFYIYRDNEIVITPALRSGEGQLYNDRMDSQVIDVKTYTLADKKIRIVPEIVGHAVDLDYVAYADLLRSRFGFENLKEARTGFVDKVVSKFGIKRYQEIPAQENFLVGKEIKDFYNKKGDKKYVEDSQ